MAGAEDSPDTVDSITAAIRTYSTQMTLTKDQWAELRELHRKRIRLKKLLNLVMPPPEDDLQL